MNYNVELLAAVIKAKIYWGNPQTKIAQGVSYTIDPKTLKKVKR